MRVTKRVETHVKKQIEAGMPFGAPTEEFDAAKKNMRDTVSEIDRKTREYVAQLCAETSAELPEGFKIAPTSYRLVDYSWYNSPLERAADKHEREICAARAKAVESILLSLELGATKADLERLISEAIS